MPKFSLFILIAICFFLQVAGQQSGKTTALSPHEDPVTARIHQMLDRANQLEKAKPDSAAYYYSRATALAARARNRQLLVACMDQHVQMLNAEGKFEDALSLSLQHIDISNQVNDQSVQLLAYNEAANEYEYLGDYQPATAYYLRSLKLATSTNNKTMQRKINNNIGSVFLALKDYATGYTYSSRAYQMALEEKDTNTMGNCLVNMGIAELYRKRYRQALLNFDEAEQIGKHLPDMTLVADALSDKGLVYLTTHKLRAAAASYEEQKSIADKYNLPYEKLYSLFQLALVEKEKGNFKTANIFASRAISIGERLGTTNELMEMYDSMAVIKQKLGDFKAALENKNKYVAIYDSLNSQQVQTNIHHLNIQYRSAQKDKQIAEQNLRIEKSKAAIERQNTWMFVSLAGIVSLGVILILSFRSYRHKRRLYQQQLLTMQKEHQVSTLEAKMQVREEERNRIAREMHDDIGSSLTTILYLSNDLKTENKEAAAFSADRISATAASVVDKMNEIIWSMNPDYDSLNDLIAYIRQYCAEFLSDHDLAYHLAVPGSMEELALGGEQRRNLLLVIKEALHNIVKHADATEVSIEFQINDRNLNIFIRDDGKGCGPKSAFGNGLKNMQHRMETVGGDFKITSEKGTSIQLTCPLSSNLAS